MHNLTCFLLYNKKETQDLPSGIVYDMFFALQQLGASLPALCLDVII